MRGYVLLFLTLTGLHVAASQQAKDKRGKDSSVCLTTTPVGPAPSKPVLPSTYIARVECNIVDKGYSVDVHEYYDQKLDAGSVHELQENVEVWALYDYKTNELLMISSATGTPVDTRGAYRNCEVDNLANDPQNFLFGYKSAGNGSGMIFSANGALRFGGSNQETYIGKDVVRGITVNGWRSCLYWDFVDATMNVDWYFTASSWNASIGPSLSVPVRAHVYGKVYDTPMKARKFEHFYEFADFRNTFYSSREFEVPRGTYCPGRKNTLPLPTPANYFSFEVEIVKPEMKSLSRIKEYYDYDAKLVRYDFVPSPKNYGTNNRLTQIHDFNTGIAYIMDRQVGNCSIKAIDPTEFDDELVGSGTVRIRNPKEFFNFDKANYIYEGKRKARNIDCDVWIGRRHDWPPGVKNLNTTWEWYFATQDWMDRAGETYTNSQPVMLEVYSEKLRFHLVYNIYNYDQEKPDMWNFNLLPCFNYTMRQDIEFQLPGKFKSVVLKSEYVFKRAIYKTISSFVNISPIRIANLKFDYGQGDIVLSFSMLDVAPISGDAANVKQQTTVAVAADLLITAIRNGEFAVKVTDKTSQTTITLKALPMSLTAKSVLTINEPSKTLKPKKNPYTSGHLVAIGLSMLFGCFLLACALTYLVYKKRGGSWSSFTPKTFDNEK